VRCTLADGTESISRAFEAEVHWLGIWLRVLVAEIEGIPLLGMALLGGCFVGIEVKEGGLVEIRPLP
jgi:hypothetical protein